MKIFHKAGDYRYNKVIFLVGMLVCVGLMVYIMSLYNFDFGKRIYTKCEPDFGHDYCENPFYMNEYSQYCKEEWCTQQYIGVGVYGEPIPEGSSLYGKFGFYCFIIILVCFLLNHLIFNWGKIPKLKINLKEETIEKIKKFGGKFEDD